MENGTENKVRRRIAKFYRAYYEELRRQVDRYPGIKHSFPEFMTGAKRIEVLWGKDGLVVSHWKAGKDTFEFKRKDRSVENIIRDLSGGRINFDFPPGTEMDLSIAEVKLYDENSLDGPRNPEQEPIWRSPWHRLDISGEYNAERWSEELARSKAVTDVQVYMTARLMDLSDPSMIAVMQGIESVTLGFIEMLREGTPDLEDARRYLRNDPVLIAPTAARILKDVRLGEGCNPDFVVELADQKYVLVKIESPQHSLSDENGDPSEELTRARRQVEDWSRWVQDHLAEARAAVPGISEPECRLVIGRRSSIGGQLVDTLAEMNAGGNVTVQTYDDLLDAATGYLHHLLELLEGPEVQEDPNAPAEGGYVRFQ